MTDIDDDDDAGGGGDDTPNMAYTEEGLAALDTQQQSQWELQNGPENIEKLQSWKTTMSAFVKAQNMAVLPTTNVSQASQGDVSQLEDKSPSHRKEKEQLPGVDMIEETEVEKSLDYLDPEELKDDQRQAYNIITWHMDQTLANQNPPLLRMVLYGEGGTGKSWVIQTVSQYFQERRAKHLLIKAVYTGVVASLIDGKTLHVIGHILVNCSAGVAMRDDVKKELQQFWKDYTYLIIDEYSMISKSFLA
ncbi:hypothetical protein D9758_018123 [Tetrapyrgos nigripes]|uniref:ATP-dependent DNA helicase n=1 Tax=Tetrapyrgos nigripes TaxID=182062 RepID=A0A8H5BXX0_9AGAR|nr:hypothetical protein D9758_018123 [Tetrapyrgos nigripes]